MCKNWRERVSIIISPGAFVFCFSGHSCIFTLQQAVLLSISGLAAFGWLLINKVIINAAPVMAIAIHDLFRIKLLV